MSTLFIEPHYLPSLEYFVVLSQFDQIYFDINGRYKKQTYRNRTYLLTANGPHPLSVPVKFGNHTPYKDVRIDYSQSWVRDHWGAFYSAYGKSPYFDHFGEMFENVWSARHSYLMDLNQEMLSLCFRLLGWQNVMQTESPKNPHNDLRDVISAKAGFETRQFYRSETYLQNFGKAFVPNMGILDPLLCLGPEAAMVIKNSIATPAERFAN